MPRLSRPFYLQGQGRRVHWRGISPRGRLRLPTSIRQKARAAAHSRPPRLPETALSHPYREHLPADSQTSFPVSSPLLRRTPVRQWISPAARVPHLSLRFSRRGRGSQAQRLPIPDCRITIRRRRLVARTTPPRQALRPPSSGLVCSRPNLPRHLTDPPMHVPVAWPRRLPCPQAPPRTCPAVRASRRSWLSFLPGYGHQVGRQEISTCPRTIRLTRRSQPKI